MFAPDVLAGRAALVTGGGSGIGFGISQCLLEGGASVAILSRSAERLDEAAARLEATTGRAPFTLTADVRDHEALADAVGKAAEQLGSLDILINNAAGNFYVPSAEMSPNAWRAVVEIDLFGTFFGCQAAFPIMREQGFGRIISTSMTLHYRGWPRMAHATAAKAGVDALTRTLALEWAGHGINVNAIAPGPIPTEGVKEAFRGNFACRFVPVGRLGTPTDIGRMVTFLASPAGDWITGAIFVVDGGESLASPREIGRSAEGTGGEDDR